MLAEARRVAADIGGLLGVEVDAATMLAGRAAMMNLTARGRISAGGATRLLRTADGWCAVALPRDDDVAALPALMEVDEVAGDHWAALTRWAATCPTDERGRPRSAARHRRRGAGGGRARATGGTSAAAAAPAARASTDCW